MPTSAKPDWRYRFIFTALSPLLAAHSIWQGLRSDNMRLSKQRLGKQLPLRNDHPLWLHMASVGEVNAARPLIDALRHHHPQLPLIVSTITASGAETCARRLPAGIGHFFLPLDFQSAVQHCLDHIQPRALIVLETEIWPRLYAECLQRNIPLIIINGRLSRRTLNKPAWIRAIYQQALRNVTQVLARSAADGQHFQALGVPSEHIETLGNLKFSQPANNTSMPTISLSRPWVLAASTHADEELQISRAWFKAGLDRDYLLVIVPRHPHRGETLVKQFRDLGMNCALRSLEQPVTRDTQIYFADTFGELPSFIAGASLVFVGGSLIPRGGQNILEVAQLGKVAIFGPHMDNFRDESELLLHNQAAVQVNNYDELIEKIRELLVSPDKLVTMGQAAQHALSKNYDVTERYLHALEKYL
ncbi:MAG: 3-deoxy-D-manno-octulosonic acid transferase [Gammaproteobacteria bacterium]|nr:3-deoxy-D-manno-octulosonic acid transferase [Gammaproteobacteria bacterium]